MSAPHWLQRPPSNSHPRIGMLSRGLIRVPHDGQADRPNTTERPAGSRCTTTFKKLPSIDPTVNTHTAQPTPTSSIPMALEGSSRTSSPDGDPCSRSCTSAPSGQAHPMANATIAPRTTTVKRGCSPYSSGAGRGTSTGPATSATSPPDDAETPLSAGAADPPGSVSNIARSPDVSRTAGGHRTSRATDFEWAENSGA